MSKGLRKEAAEFTPEEWKAHKSEHPNADRSDHTIINPPKDRHTKPMFRKDDPNAKDVKIPKAPKVPVITEEDEDKVEKQLKQKDHDLKTMAPGKKNQKRRRQDQNSTDLEIEKQKKIIDDPKSSERDVYDAIRNLGIMEDNKRNKTATRVLTRYLTRS